ncbi:hypothetical protein RHS01_09876 [Rhizoctonia solani]|uniref:Uncharacterized protein n=1 Tax=Rhizoctonia solani TaxID=456999 RepID=A0A8H7I647_9AGAM|nr:hypothetical protein RHS01_09876 [Rhizoctonia solani]
MRTRQTAHSREDRFMPCRLASDLLRRLASYKPSAAARICASFLSYPPSRRSRELVWAATHEPDSRSGAPGPPSLLRSRGGSPTLTGLGLVADEDERAEDNYVCFEVICVLIS